MSNRTLLSRAGVGSALAMGVMLISIPAAAQAAPVDLATAGSFAALGGSTVTNTGPTVLHGDLGVAPGTALVGFGSPATVNGATHANDAVANQAQSNLTTAYDVAAAEPVSPANNLTGLDLGNRTLTAGAYRYTSSAQLTGQLTLDAQGDPNAQFVFEIASTLTTASASSVRLIGGASPCNVYWQVGSSATLGSTTSLQGTVMALTDISLGNGATVLGRLLARNGQISLINNVVDSRPCNTASTSTATPGATTPGQTQPGAATPGGPASGADAAAQPPGGPATTTGVRTGTSIVRRVPRTVCTEGFRATVRGKMIKRVIFSLDGKRIASRTGMPFQVSVRATPGAHNVSARVSFKDATPTKTWKLGYRVCAARVLRPRPGPSRFAG